MYNKIVLSNGLRVVGYRMAHMESCALGIWINSGSRNERKKNAGISHFLEHLLFKGTKNRSGKKIKEEIEGRGGSLNGFTSEEMTCYLAKVSGQHLKIALDVLSDIVLHPSLKQGDIEKERMVIIEEIKMNKDLPSHYVHDLLNELLWPDQPLGMSISGTVESISSIAKQDLSEYKNKNYNGANFAVVVCGNIDYEKVARQTEECFLNCQKGRPSNFNLAEEEQGLPCFNFLFKETEQTHLSMGLRTFGRDHKDRHALSLLHIILGANMSSRLFNEIREKRALAYEIGTQIKRYRETGAFVINAGIEHKKVLETVKVILQELKKIRKEGVSKNEFLRAKEFFKVQLLLALEDTIDHMLWLGEHIITLNKLPTPQEVISEMEQVRAPDIQRIADEIFKDKNLNLAMIGTLKDKDTKNIREILRL